MLPDVIDVIIELMAYDKDVSTCYFIKNKKGINYECFMEFIANIKMVKWSRRQITKKKFSWSSYSN